MARILVRIDSITRKLAIKEENSYYVCYEDKPF
jgi:transcription initiation factor IIE alpha subunit